MSTINVRRCVTSGANTGPSACDFDLGRVIGLIAIPKGTGIAQANFTQTAFLSAMATGTRADLRSARWYPIDGLIAYTPAIGDLQREDLPYASTSKFVRRGNIDVTFRIDAKIDRAQRLNRLINQSQGRFDFLFVMEIVGGGYGIFGTQTATAANVATLYGHSMRDVMMLTTQLATDSATTMHQLMMSFANPNALNENMGFIFTDINPLMANPGLVDVYLANGRAGATTGTVIFRPVAGTTPLVDLFATQILTTSNFVVTNANTNASVTPSAVAIINGDEIQLTTALAATPLRIRFSANSVLTTNSMPDFESDEIVVTTAA